MLERSTPPSWFTPADEALMAEASPSLAARGFAPERSKGPVDYFRIADSNAGTPRWIVARHLDGTYHLYSGNLEPLKAGATLRDILVSEWLAF